MNFVKIFLSSACLLSLTCSCNNPSVGDNTSATDQTAPNSDSLIEKEKPGGKDLPSEPIPDTAAPTLADRMLIGRHNLTLQWIGSNVPGMAMIEKKDDRGWYPIKGRQESSEGYLKIDGKLRPVFENYEDELVELEFEGIIDYREKTINDNQPCIKSGRQMFLSTKQRKYWRLQNMLNCDSITTDYVDIYF